MSSWPLFRGTLCSLMLGMVLIGCGQRPLARLRTQAGCPWCAPHKQVQVGDRSQGKSFYGDIWKRFWIDDQGNEYDPEQVSQQVWTYLTQVGEAAKIDQTRKTGACSSQMRIVSVNPVVVLLEPCQHRRFDPSKGLVGHGTKLAQELAYTPDSDMYFDEPMQWLSPDLNTGPTLITFSPEGIATIPLKSGQLRLVREGERCKVTRE